MKYYSAKTVTKILGVTAQTLRNWDKEGKLKPTYVKSNGYRYYSEESILSYTQERKTKKNLNIIGYARVSSKKQSDDLERQVDNIKNYLSNKYESLDIITDIGYFALCTPMTLISVSITDKLQSVYPFIIYLIVIGVSTFYSFFSVKEN